MSGSSDPDSGQRGGRAEIVEFGAPRRQHRSWLARLLLASLVAAALVFVLYHPGNHRARHLPPAQPPVEITRIGHRVLGISANWDLFGLSSNNLVSIQFARGQVIRTRLPRPEGSGPISFIVEPHDVIMRPLDNVPGFVVPDGLPPRKLAGLLAEGGLLLPGPAPDQKWFVDGVHAVTLVGPGGRTTGVTIAAAAQAWPAESVMADGRGDVLLFNDAGVLYDAGPRSLRRVGMLLAAIGPQGWLGVNCARNGCHDTVIDASTGAERTLPGPALQVVTWPWPAQPGVIAPNGSYAGVTVSPGGLNVALAVIDLRTGVVTTVPLAIDPSSSSRTLAWSPDSRWLFVVTASGGLAAVNPVDCTVHGLGIRLPPLSQIAMRGAAG